MKLFFLLIVAALSLSGCANNFKALSEEYKDQRIETSVHYNKATRVKIPYTQVSRNYGGGGSLAALLIIAAVDAAINVNAQNQARKRHEVINKYVKDFDYNKHVYMPTVKTLRKAEWLDIKKVNSNGGYFNAQGALNIGGTNFVALVSFDLQAPTAVSLQNTFRLQLFSSENKEDPIYKLTITELYSNPGTGLFDGEEAQEWGDQDGALIKDAIQETTRKINEKLAIYLADPFDKKAQERVMELSR